jgi:hypothetical protein
MIVDFRPLARTGLLGLSFVFMSLLLVGCGGQETPIVDTSTKGGVPGSLPTPTKAALPVQPRPNGTSVK